MNAIMDNILTRRSVRSFVSGKKIPQPGQREFSIGLSPYQTSHNASQQIGQRFLQWQLSPQEINNGRT